MIVFEKEVEQVHLTKLLYIWKWTRDLLEKMEWDVEMRTDLSPDRVEIIEDTISTLKEMDAQLDSKLWRLEQRRVESRFEQRRVESRTS